MSFLNRSLLSKSLYVSFLLCNLYSQGLVWMRLYISSPQPPDIFLIFLNFIVMQVILDWLGSFPSWGADNTSRSELYSVGCTFIGLHSSNVSCIDSSSPYSVSLGSTVHVCMLKYFVLLLTCSNRLTLL
jgi:hypothetical protein